MLECAAEFSAEVGDLAVGEGAGGGELTQVRTLDQLGDEVGGAVVAAQLVEGDDPRMVEAGGGVGLAEDPAGCVALDRLDSDPAAQALVPGAVHGPVAAGSEALADRESAQ